MAKQDKGFTLLYEITDCPLNCSSSGVCQDHICKCQAGKRGRGCEIVSCPDQCSLALNQGECNMTTHTCDCKPGFYGESCSISTKPNSNQNSWHNISSFLSGFKARSGHVSTYFSVNNYILVHGGTSLSVIYDDLLLYNMSSQKWTPVIPSGLKPSGRYHHAADQYEDCLIFYGGEMQSGELSDELWMFNTTTYTWTLLSNGSANGTWIHDHPPALASPTLTVVETNIYLFGGKSGVDCILAGRCY